MAENNVRIEDHEGNSFYPHTNAAVTFLANGTTMQQHADNRSNPHGVTAEQVALGNVRNFGVATQAEAEAGTSAVKYMTPQRTAQAISKLTESKLSNKGVWAGDLNDCIADGFYYAHGATTNRPNTTISWHIIVIRYSDTYVKQIAFGASGANGASSAIRTRALVNDTWEPWDKVLTQADYDTLFQSVSNGKSAVASAITGKGVPTSAIAEFAVMAANISAIQTGKKSASGTTFMTGNSETATLAITGLAFRPKHLRVEGVAWTGYVIFDSDWGVNPKAFAYSYNASMWFQLGCTAVITNTSITLTFTQTTSLQTNGNSKWVATE